MNKTYNSKLKSNARELRKDMTDHERMLWKMYLKDLPYTVRRQKIIENFIVVFYISEFQIAIEIDGGQHCEEEGARKDAERDARLAALGITVLRYSNHEINTAFYDVCTDISNHLVKTK